MEGEAIRVAHIVQTLPNIIQFMVEELTMVTHHLFYYLMLVRSRFLELVQTEKFVDKFNITYSFKKIKFQSVAFLSYFSDHGSFDQTNR